jgi:hypothetical protein
MCCGVEVLPFCCPSSIGHPSFATSPLQRTSRAESIELILPVSGKLLGASSFLNQLLLRIGMGDRGEYLGVLSRFLF